MPCSGKEECEMSRRSGALPRLRSWVVAAVVGTSLAYFFDGDDGIRRRQQLRDRSRAWSRRIRERLDRHIEYSGGRIDRSAQERLQMEQHDNPNPDDNTLRDRIESEVFGDPNVPKGEYNLNVVDGIAELHGQLESQDDIDTLIQMVGAVRDVRAVESYLHLPGVPAPDKVSAIEASDMS
jgi:hypothetical protein